MGAGTIADKFDVAIQLEEVAGLIYEELAAQADDDTERRSIFRRLASEEVEHANRIRMLRSRYINDSTTMEDAVLDGAGMERLLGEAEDILETLKSGRVLSDDEAMRLMVNIEKRFASTHAQAMLASGDPELRRFFESLSRQDTQHAALIASTGSGARASSA